MKARRNKISASPGQVDRLCEMRIRLGEIPRGDQMGPGPEIDRDRNSLVGGSECVPVVASGLPARLANDNHRCDEDGRIKRPMCIKHPREGIINVMLRFTN